MHATRLPSGLVVVGFGEPPETPPENPGWVDVGFNDDCEVSPKPCVYCGAMLPHVGRKYRVPVLPVWCPPEERGSGKWVVENTRYRCPNGTGCRKEEP